jgi:hypothetical protein
MTDKNRIQDTLNELAFPRLSGTQSERDAYDKVKTRIERLGFSPKSQEFVFSAFYSRIYPRLTLTLLSWLLLVLFLNISVIFNIVNLFLIVIFLIIVIKLTRTPEKIKLGHVYQSQNLFLKIPSKSQIENADHNVLFFSHLDSKGQRFPIKIRIQLYYYWIITFPSAFIFILLNSFFLSEFSIFFYILEVILLTINLLAIIILWINVTNNKSPGAIDNASGVSCVLEILQYYTDPQNRLNNITLWFVFTGAEESGTMGVRNFYKNIRKFDREETYTINFDCIGKKVTLWDHGLLNNKYYKSYNYILENKDVIKLAKKTHRVYIGAYSDGLFLLNKKFKGIGNGDKGNNNYVHSKNDTLDLIDIRVIKKLSKFYNILLHEVDINLNK